MKSIETTYVSLLALAETAETSEEYLKQSAAAERLRLKYPQLATAVQLDTRVAMLADHYRKNGV